MELQLNDAELDLLRELLARVLGDMNYEIADTDNSEFRARLRARREILKSLVDKAGAPAHEVT